MAIEENFEQESFKIFAQLEDLLLKAIHKEDHAAHIRFVKKTYKEDVNCTSLETELLILQTMFKDHPVAVTTLNDIHIHLQSIPKHLLRLIPNVMIICELIIINPATSAEAERSFSLGRRLKSWQRSTMKQERFSSLAILQEYKELTDEIDLVDIGNQFASKHDDRYKLFGKFVKSDVE